MFFHLSKKLLPILSFLQAYIYMYKIKNKRKMKNKKTTCWWYWGIKWYGESSAWNSARCACSGYSIRDISNGQEKGKDWMYVVCTKDTWQRGQVIRGGGARLPATPAFVIFYFFCSYIYMGCCVWKVYESYSAWPWRTNTHTHTHANGFIRKKMYVYECCTSPRLTK